MYNVTVETNLEQILEYKDDLTLGEALVMIKKYHDFPDDAIATLLGLMRTSMSLEVTNDTHTKYIKIEHGKEKEI